MSATVIDSLLITLGLDTSGFKKGAAGAKKATKETEGVVKKSAESMVKSLRSVGLEFIGLFLAVKSVNDVVHYLSGLSAATRQLGIDAKNFGTSAAELRDWQNAAILAGGSAEDVTKTIGGLQQSLFNLKFNGQVNDQIITLQRLGVNFRTATNQVKPFNDIMIETAGAIQRSHLSRQDSFNFLQQAGFDKGSIQLILQGTEAVKAAIAQQKKLPQVSDADVQANTRMQQSWELLKEKIEAGSIKLLTHAEPAITKLFGAFNKGVDWILEHQDDIGKFFDGIVDWATGPGADGALAFFHEILDIAKDLAATLKVVAEVLPSIKTVGKVLGVAGKVFTNPVDKWARGAVRGAAGNVLGFNQAFGDKAFELGGGLVDAVKGAFNYAGGRADQDANRIRYAPTIDNAEKQYGIPKGILSRLVQQESAFRSDIISGKTKSAAGATGIAQLLPKYFPDAGKNADNDINTGAKYLASLYKQFGSWELAAAAYNDGPGNVKKILAGKKAIPQETKNYVSAVVGGNATPGARQTVPSGTPRVASNTSVQIDNITVQTQATNAGRMAADLDAAVQRKLFSAHSDGGVT